MGLINLQTNLLSLGWGQDQPYGGDSGLPYIKTFSPEQSSQAERIIIESAKFSSDFPIRGGLYSIRAAAEDSIRIRKFLTDFPKGSNFTYKQVGLQKSNPLIETGKNGGRINTQTYNLNSNLLLSVLNAGNGDYYPRPGATPYTLLDDENKYFSIVGKKSTDDNRLVNLYKSKIKFETLEDDKLFELGISNNDFLILDYIGGPNSLYGDGNTIIGRATDNTGNTIFTGRYPTSNYIKLSSPLTPNVLGISNYLTILDPTLVGDKLNHTKGIYNIGDDVKDEITNEQREKNTFKTFYNTLPYNKIIQKQPYVLNTTLVDFRTEVEEPNNVFSRDYSDPLIPMTTRIKIGSPGARPKELRNDINAVFKDGQDKVNLIPIIYKNYNEAPELEDDARDLIKFNFETIDNNNINNTTRTHFRAFLKGFDDNHSGDWVGKRYTGRGDNMFTYQGFDRKITFSFIISAQSKQEMKPLWQKLNYLTSTLYPDYSTQGFMRGNITRLTIGEYLYRVPGVLTSLNYSISDNYPWEIKIDQPEEGYDNDMMELPQIMNVSVSFTPILDSLAQTGQKTPIIMSDKVNRNFINEL